MITKEQITEILNNHAGYIDRSRTEQAIHEDNFNDVAEEILSKLSQHDVSGQSEQLVCDHPDEAIIKDKPTDYCLACNRNI